MPIVDEQAWERIKRLNASPVACACVNTAARVMLELDRGLSSASKSDGGDGEFWCSQGGWMKNPRDGRHFLADPGWVLAKVTKPDCADLQMGVLLPSGATALWVIALVERVYHAGAWIREEWHRLMDPRPAARAFRPDFSRAIC